MEGKETIYKLAYSFLKGMTSETVRKISDSGVSPEDFFGQTTRELVKRLDISNKALFESLPREEAVVRARKESELIDKHHIKAVFLLDDDYPKRLSAVEDAPIILYKLGETDLDSEQIASIVGTRRPTPYGVDFCGKLIKELSEYFPDIVITSGLAYGIDAIAHTKALECNVPTIAVVAHGLNMIYPAAHRDLARTILKKGGAILSEYPFGVKPFKANFLERNRIVAALSDVTVVVESAIKGGAMSTANFAFSYSRDVMALPGRISDENSEGCNLLIRKQKASLITGAADLIETTGWKIFNIKLSPQQRNLFPELDGENKIVYELLKFSREPLQADRLCSLSKIPVSRLMTILSELEFDGIIIRYPGNRYTIS